MRLFWRIFLHLLLPYQGLKRSTPYNLINACTAFKISHCVSFQHGKICGGTSGGFGCRAEHCRNRCFYCLWNDDHRASFYFNWKASARSDEKNGLEEQETLYKTEPSVRYPLEKMGSDRSKFSYTPVAEPCRRCFAGQCFWRNQKEDYLLYADKRLFLGLCLFRDLLFL